MPWGEETRDAGCHGEYYEKCIKYMIFGNVLRNKTYPVSVSSNVLSKRWLSFVTRRRSGRTAWLMESTGAGNDQVRFDLCFPCLPGNGNYNPDS